MTINAWICLVYGIAFGWVALLNMRLMTTDPRPKDPMLLKSFKWFSYAAISFFAAAIIFGVMKW